MNPKIDVIIPTFARAHTIGRAILSVSQQTYPHWELWVIEDGPCELSAGIVLTLQKELKAKGQVLHYLSGVNRGVSFARNKGLTHSSAPWVAFLDSDDQWLPQKLEWQLEMIESQPQNPLVHGDEIWVRNGVRVNPMKKHQKGGGDQFYRSLEMCLISPSAALIRRELLEEEKGFKEDFPVCEDFDLWLRITQRYEVSYVPRPLLIKYGGHEDQLSRRFLAMDYWRVRALFQLLQTHSLSDKQKQAVAAEIIKKSSILLKGYTKHHRQNDPDALEVQGFFHMAQNLKAV